MKYFAHWQPLQDEDKHTALLFGFLRHAPLDAGLNPWLQATLGRPLEATPLAPSDFWPRYASLVEGSAHTEPELVFAASDGRPLTVVIEVKPGYGMLMLPQIAREVIDTANARGSQRVACVMIGADLAAPMDLPAWKAEVEAQLGAALPARNIEVELAYSSFASLGRAAISCAAAAPEWRSYADDVVAHLRRRGLLGYDGAPMLDDLEELTLPNAVEAFNRAILAARDFFLQLHAQPRFEELRLSSIYAPQHRMYRNGGSEALTQPVEWFRTTVLMTAYRRPEWDEKRSVFVCFDLRGNGRSTADLLAGAALLTDGLTYAFDSAQLGARPSNEALNEAERRTLHEMAANPSQWRFERRPWEPGNADEDIAWTLKRLEDGIAIWEEEFASIPGLTHPDFNGRSTQTLEGWLKWWSDPARSPDGKEEAGRDPADEVVKIQRELGARASSP